MFRVVIRSYFFQNKYMNLAKYRDTSDYREILRLFKKSSELQENLLWQNINGKREVYKVDHLEIDFVGREVVVFLDNHQKIQSNEPIYFKLAAHDSVFKHNGHLVQPDCVSFKFPEMLKTKEFRGSERFILGSADECAAVVSFGQDSDIQQQMKIQLLDFSSQGLGLVVSEKNKHLIRASKVLWVHAINDYVFSRPIAACVMYLTTEAQNKKFRFGIQLEKQLPREVISTLIH